MEKKNERIKSKRKISSKTTSRDNFLEKHQKNIIQIVDLAIKTYNDGNKNTNANIRWESRVDKGLAKHLLIMFEKTKNIPLNQITINKFKSMWSLYIKTDEYYMQILNYIVNSDDYIYGDRLNYKTNSNRNTIRPSNYLGNAMRRWEGFEKNPSSKRIYYSKLMAMAQGLNGIVND